MKGINFLTQCVDEPVRPLNEHTRRSHPGHHREPPILGIVRPAESRDRIESGSYILRTAFHHRVVDQLPLRDKTNAKPERVIVFHELVEHLFTEIDIDRALGIEPRPSWTGPVELVVAEVVGQDLVSDVVSVVKQDQAARWHHRPDVLSIESRVVLPFFGNPPERRNPVCRL